MTVVPADMREWEAPEQADILVSELLGSFGDNELSPGGRRPFQIDCQVVNLKVPSWGQQAVARWAAALKV